ncbi:HIRAN domain-containing protein [Thermomonas flagellata]|uniref:HIRAN domain-containing protein n=1 Tax=Thermomonas flagellata TaxID=2888524 RepID=UPI001F036A23|nr:HIRAN domain-containing protein [Thermomonas flagellata]
MKAHTSHAGSPAAPVFLSASAPQPPTVRARLWLPGRAFGPADDQPRLWLILADGRVLAFRLPKVALGDDMVIAPLAQAMADDPRGVRWEIEHPAFGWAQVLYAAPVLPAPKKDHAAFLFDPGYRRFLSCLDEEIMRRLLSLEREAHPPAVTRRDGEAPHPLPRLYLASVRNYNRLVALPEERRERRMQAIARFPVLVAPILLTLHHSPNVHDGKRHAWREKDAAIEAAIDAGRDLAGALARHYGISKGLVRAPLCAQMWPVRDGNLRRGWLKLLDALPANQRPTLAEFERWQLYLANYFALLGENDHGHPMPQPPAVYRGAFRLGWSRTWETATRRYGDLHPALADCRDFLNAAREMAARRLHRAYGPPMGRLAAGWLACHGLLGLLEASRRWHRLRPVPERWDAPEGFRLPAILGHWQDRGRHAEELLTPEALIDEGEAMNHCVANYWPECVAGDRIFALHLPDGERATAQYRPTIRDDVDYDTEYRLAQLRGPFNQEVSAAMFAWAHNVACELNQPSRQEARWAALETRGRLDVARHDARRHWLARLDAKSERQLAAVLGWLGVQPPGPEVLLYAHIAGYQYHAGPKIEAQLASGQPLELVREPDNPHDAQAVRLNWQGYKLGYVPREHNVEIAARLDAGERLIVRITDIDFDAEPWRRVGFMVEKATDAQA